MVTYTLKATEQEANQILANSKAFIFRSSDTAYRAGDRIRFQVMKQGRMKKHGIENNLYEISYASDQAPVEKGFTVIGFRKIR